MPVNQRSPHRSHAVLDRRSAGRLVLRKISREPGQHSGSHEALSADRERTQSQQVEPLRFFL
jgi:hypothetical protein